MVVGVKKTMQQVPSRGRISIMRIQHFTIERRQSVIRVVYGALLVTIGMITAIVDPVEVATNWFMDIKEGSFIFRVYEKPPYQLYCDVWIFNYTNVPQYLKGEEKTLKVKEVGPFRFEEIRTNNNMRVDRERGVMNFEPNIKLNFLPEESVGHYRDVKVFVPNIALIAMSTLFSDKLSYALNAAAYYSMSTLGSKLFLNMTAEQLLWGYTDPVVTLANTFLPGWIDFGKIGMMDRFYAQRNDTTEVEIRNISTKYSINTFNNAPGLREQGYTDLNTSVPCNLIQGSYEGLLVTPPLSKDKTIRFFRRQACRIIPIGFKEEIQGKYGFDYYRFMIEKSAFNKTSDYACPCSRNCLPDGFIDVSSCYYGFPISLSKPHFLDADAAQLAHFEGMKPDPKYESVIDLEPKLGVPISIAINIQVNIAVRMSPGNTLTRPLANKVIPVMWFSLNCKEPPPEIINILRLRLVIAPPLVITVEVFLFLIGLFLGIQGFHRIWKPKYRLIDPAVKEENLTPKRKKSMERRLSTVILNMSDNIGFNRNDEELAKQAVSLLAITEEDNDMPDLLMTDS